MRHPKCWLLISLLFFPLVLFALTQDRYVFTNQNDRERFQLLMNEFRCLVCQNQNLADSEASLAEDLRKQIYDLVNDGKSNPQIIDYMTDRYGDFILFQPPLKAATWFLWFSPFLLLLIGFFCLRFFCKDKKT